MEAVLEETITLDPDKDYETFNGIPEEKAMAGARHGRVGTRLIITLGQHVVNNDLGVVYGPDTTFKVGEDDRLPDISFVALDRIPEDGDPEGLWDIAPDLAVEVVSPNDIYQKLMNKVFDYLAARAVRWNPDQSVAQLRAAMVAGAIQMRMQCMSMKSNTI